MDKETILDFDLIRREIASIKSGEGGAWYKIEEALKRIESKMP